MSDLPEVAVRAGADALKAIPFSSHMDSVVSAARAVLLAATERVPCFACAHNDEPGTQWDSDTDTWRECVRCRGSGFLYVLKQETET